MDELCDRISKYQISHLLCVPSLFTVILEHCDRTRFASIVTVIVAGEACSPDVVTKHFEQLPGVALFNEYGPAEATVWTTVAELKVGGRS